MNFNLDADIVFHEFFPSTLGFAQQQQQQQQQKKKKKKNPSYASYTYIPVTVEVMPPYAYSIETNKKARVVVVDPEAYTYDDEVIKKAEAMGKPGLVKIISKEDRFIFTVESTGAIKAYQLVINVIEVLRQKLDAIRLEDSEEHDFNELSAHLGGI